MFPVMSRDLAKWWNSLHFDNGDFFDLRHNSFEELHTWSKRLSELVNYSVKVEDEDELIDLYYENIDLIIKIFDISENTLRSVIDSTSCNCRDKVMLNLMEVVNHPRTFEGIFVPLVAVYIYSRDEDTLIEWSLNGNE